MQVCKITQINQIFIISILLFFSMNLAGQTTEKRRLTKNKVIIDKTDYDKKKAGFEKYEIEQLLKPKPVNNFFTLWFYNLRTPEFVKNKQDAGEEKCNDRKSKRISPINEKIRHFEKELKNQDKNSARYEKNSKKLKRLNDKKENKEEKSCKKQHITRKIGEAPVFFSNTDVNKNSRRIKMFLQNKGYYEIKTDTIITLKKRNRIKITYKIYPEKPLLISNINYNITNDIISKIVSEDKLNSILIEGERLDIQAIEDERKRISDKLRNLGYYDFSKDYIFFSIDTIGKTYGADISININTILNNDGDEIKHKKHIIKDVFIYPFFKPNEALINKEDYYKNQDTIIYYSKDNRKYHLIYKESPRINPKAIARGLYIKPDDYFNLEKIKASYKYLAALPIIQTANINFEQTNTLYEINDTVKYIDCEIKLTQDKLQAGEFSAEFTNTDSNLGTGGTLNYTHNNFFRNTETFDLKLNGELKRITKTPDYTITDDTTAFFNSTTWGIDMSIKIPRLFIPLPLKKFIQRSNPKTVINANVSYTDRPDYKWSIAGGAMAYSWDNTKAIKVSLGPAVDFLKVYEKIDEVELSKSFEDRFVLGFPFKLTFNNQLSRTRKNYFYVTAYAKAAGNFLDLTMGMFNIDKTDNSYILFGNAFAQFFKTDFDIRYYKKLSRAKDNLVFRIFMGAALPYGNLDVIPFSEQYFSGGANGIRAWEERSLGPGSISDTAILNTFGYYNQRSDIKLEGNIEYRMKLFWKLEGALFVDAGNIWAINNVGWDDNKALFEFNRFYKEIAIGSGFGIRMDLDFLIVRVDIGLKIKDPSESEGSRWIPANDIYRTNNMKFNLGIGYPF